MSMGAFASVGAYICGYMGVWVRASVGACECGCVRVWMSASLGAYQCGCVRVWVRASVGICECGHMRVWVCMSVSKNGCVWVDVGGWCKCGYLIQIFLGTVIPRLRNYKGRNIK